MYLLQVEWRIQIIFSAFCVSLYTKLIVVCNFFFSILNIDYFIRKVKTTSKKLLWGAKTWTFMVGIKPHLLTRMRPRRIKCLERPHSGWSCREIFEDTSPRGLSSSDLTNVDQVSFFLTWVIFQEIPATKIDFRYVKKG